jgi:hypothetical protein
MSDEEKRVTIKREGYKGEDIVTVYKWKGSNGGFFHQTYADFSAKNKNERIIGRDAEEIVTVVDANNKYTDLIIDACTELNREKKDKKNKLEGIKWDELDL